MERYFHVSSLRNFESIQRNGLLPKIGPRSQAGHETVPAVYAFVGVDALEDGLVNWLADVLDPDEPVMIIELDLTGFTLQREVQWEVTVLEPVLPQRFLGVWHELDWPDRPGTNNDLSSPANTAN